MVTVASEMKRQGIDLPLLIQGDDLEGPHGEDRAGVG